MKRGDIRTYPCASGVGDTLEVAAVRGELMFRTSVGDDGDDGVGSYVYLSRDTVRDLFAQLGLWLHTPEV